MLGVFRCCGAVRATAVLANFSLIVQPRFSVAVRSACNFLQSGVFFYR